MRIPGPGEIQLSARDLRFLKRAERLVREDERAAAIEVPVAEASKREIRGRRNSARDAIRKRQEARRAR